MPFYTKLDISAEQIKAHIMTPQEIEFSQIITIDSSVQSIIQFLDTYKGQEEEQLSVSLKTVK
jgi:hypothetical protein